MINRITTMEMTGIVLNMVTYGLIKNDNFRFKPARMPSDIPRIPDKMIDRNNLNKVNPTTLSESKCVKIPIRAPKTEPIEGTSNGWLTIM